MQTATCGQEHMPDTAPSGGHRRCGHLEGLQTASVPCWVAPTSRPVLDMARLVMSEASGQGGRPAAAAEGCGPVQDHMSTLPLVPVQPITLVA